MSAPSNSIIKIKPSLIPFTWKGFIIMALGAVVYVAFLVIPFPLTTFLRIGSLVTIVAFGLIALGIFMILVGSIRRNAFTYLITDSNVVVQKQLFRRSVRRIPFSSISDVEISQSLVSRLAGYGNIAPVTKSGYGLVRGMDQSENIVAELTNVPNPDKVADLILSRVTATTRMTANA